MPAPSADAVLANPPPLNATEFPFRVDRFPASWLQEFGGLLAKTATGEPLELPPNPHRYDR